MQNRIKAFTLAEVLITLGIIGIVAAMTIPTLIAKTKANQIVVAVKKFYSNMNQAIKLSELDNGDSANWTFDNTKSDCLQTFMDTYLNKYLQIIKQDKDDEGHYRVFFNDGTTLSMQAGSCIDMMFDANGLKKPNEWGKDRFVFLYCPSSGNGGHFSSQKTFGAYYELDTRENALAKCKSNGFFCSEILMKDGWEFKDDYPYKL
ncbi:type II secretion system protein [bacterium]|nr:type II secretion system protein [bacterium]